MFIAAAVVQAPVAGSKMLVRALLMPPLTSRRPSARLVVPGQNMLCPLSVTVRSLLVFVAGSNVTV